MWKTTADAHAAADTLIERLLSLEVPPWSTRKRQFAGLTAPVAMETFALGPAHQLTLEFFDRLRERLDEMAYDELWWAIMDAELRITMSQRISQMGWGLAG
jgi:hypothetical protein